MEDVDYSHDDEISLLDLAVVIAESWKLLIIVPLLAGIMAYFVIGSTTPRMYTSEALIQADANQIALLESARVLNDPIRESSLLSKHDGRLTIARTNLIDAMDVEKLDGTEMYRVKLTLDDPDEANQLLTRIITKLIQESEPTGQYREMLELRLEAQQAALGDLTDTFARLNQGYSHLLTGTDERSPTIQGEIGQSFVTLISSIESKRQEVARTTRQLNGSLSQDDVIQTPTLPDNPEPRGLLMLVALVVVLTGFLVLIGVFVRAGLARASETPEGSTKVARIRRAFWLSSRNSLTPEG